MTNQLNVILCLWHWLILLSVLISYNYVSNLFSYIPILPGPPPPPPPKKKENKIYTNGLNWTPTYKLRSSHHALTYSKTQRTIVTHSLVTHVQIASELNHTWTRDANLSVWNNLLTQKPLASEGVTSKIVQFTNTKYSLKLALNVHIKWSLICDSTHTNIKLKLLGESARSSLTEEVKNKPL